MRKIIVTIFFFVVFSISFSLPSNAQSTWEKSGSVIFNNSSDWNSSYNRTPSLIAENNTIKMWHDGYDGQYFKIGYATSADGKNWNNNSNPVLDGSNINSHFLEPHVLKDQNRYKIWFLSVNLSTNVSSILYSESSNGINWSTPSIAISADQDWEGGSLAHPHVVKTNDKYLLYYNGGFNGNWKIGIAESTDGITWSKSTNNPIFSPNADETPTTAGPFVSLKDSKYYMYYHSKNPASNINVATSNDGINWIRESVVLTKSTEGFDTVAIISPFIFKFNNKEFIYYSGFNGSKWAIGYATREIELPDVPLYKQTANPWQSQVYDSANIWSPRTPTIYRWGCAVTSVAMLLNYHGYAKLPNNQPLDPGTLNTWLKSQPDGFVKTGLVNWHAISRLSKLAKTTNSISDFDALEFSYGGNSKAVLTQDLEDKNPVILEQPGHFVVATAPQDNTFLINDPYYDRSALNDEYGNTFMSMRRFIPSNTDLSYFMTVADLSLSIIVKNQSGDTVSDNLIQNPIKDPVSGALSGKQVNTIFIPKVESGQYTLEIKSSSTQVFTEQLYFYDKDGNVSIKEITGLADSKSDIFKITFDKNNSTGSAVAKTVTFDSLLHDLKIAKDKNLIKNAGYTSLTSLIQMAQKDYNKRNNKQAKQKLETSLLLVSSLKSMIDDSYESVLIKDIKLLRDTL